MTTNRSEGKASLETTPPHLKEFVAFLGELNKESERGAVLISCALLDELLTTIIRAFVLERPESERLLEGFNAPLGTLSARSVAALALGLISDIEYQETETIRKVRNHFAHEVHASFKEDRVKALCSNLKLAAKSDDTVTVNARGQFTSAAVGLILNLTNRPHYVAQKRRQFEPWPY